MRTLVFILLSFFALTVHALPAWQLNAKESTLTFTATQNNAPVSGQFKKFSVLTNFDPKALNNSQIQVNVDMNSVSVPYAELLDALKSTDWFNIKQFPEAVFKAKKIKQLNKNTYEADGTLTVRDHAAPLKVTFVLEEYSPTKARVKGHALLKRSTFGVGQGEWASTDDVKDDVQIDFSLLVTK
jgi:polyisoprenoid-binding protein YceI